MSTTSNTGPDDDDAPPVAPRVLISYAHDNPEHEERVRTLWTFLRANGVDARLDLLAANKQQFWPDWMSTELREARFVLVVASPAYKARAEGAAPDDEGLGVKWEARQLKDIVYSSPDGALNKIVSVVLPGGSKSDLPDWLTPASRDWYPVTAWSVRGAHKLLRLLLDRPAELEPPLLSPPDLPPNAPVTLPSETGEISGLSDRPGPRTRTVSGRVVPLRTRVAIDVRRLGDGRLASEVTIAGTPVSSQVTVVPADVLKAWSGLAAATGLPGAATLVKGSSLAAAEPMLQAGRSLGTLLFEPGRLTVLGDLIHDAPAGMWIDVVLAGHDQAGMGLPIELLRPLSSAGADPGPLATLPGVSVSRELSTRTPITTGGSGAGLAGPLKILAAVAAPDETKTSSGALDVEAEMQAILDAVTPVAAATGAQVRILEVASLGQLQKALHEDEYHVLHLSAHGSPTSIELETEDGAPDLVNTEQLLGPLREEGRLVPLIVLSSCSGAAGISEAMAAGLIGRGAQHVLAFQAPVTDLYATRLAATLYTELADHPTQPVAHAVARARHATERALHDEFPADALLPEYGLATLITHTDAAEYRLLDPTSDEQPLSRAEQPATGTTVRDLQLGQLIGRRPELRLATAALRRTPTALRTHGPIKGVELIGIGGIGKTALAGRLISRIRGDGWAIAIHEGRWNPTTLYTAVAQAIAQTPIDGLNEADRAQLADALAAPGTADEVKLGLIGQLLSQVRLLLVFDDFEQNLTTGGANFSDPLYQDIFTSLTAKATRGAVLVTTRYFLPGPGRGLVPVALPALSEAELRRLFLRLPGLRELPAKDRALLTDVVGGHPRLIEFVDALIRGNTTTLTDVQTRLSRLAEKTGVQLPTRRGRTTTRAVDDALILGAADIFLDELLTLLTPTQHALLDQLCILHAPIDPEDLRPIDGDEQVFQASNHTDALADDIAALTDLTLLTPGVGLLCHPWTGRILETHLPADEATRLHQQAVDIRLRRFHARKAGYPDLVELPRHLAKLERYNDAYAVAQHTTQMLPSVLVLSAYLNQISEYVQHDLGAYIGILKLEFEAARSAGQLRRAGDIATSSVQALHKRIINNPDDSSAHADLSVALIDAAEMAIATGNLRTAATLLSLDHSSRS